MLSNYLKNSFCYNCKLAVNYLWIKHVIVLVCITNQAELYLDVWKLSFIVRASLIKSQRAQLAYRNGSYLTSKKLTSYIAFVTQIFAAYMYTVHIQVYTPRYKITCVDRWQCFG